MFEVIDPKVSVMDYGPKVTDKSGKVILTPDQIILGSAGVTFKGMDSLTEFIVNVQDPESGLTPGKIQKKAADITARGHASLTTTPVIYFTISDSSKNVDSLFTSARFGSFLMPSSRRVPIIEENIVVPKGIREKGREAERIYLETSQRNIRLYNELQTESRGRVKKEEASKIVQYGHVGGGFLQMPLATIIGFKRKFDQNPEAIPREGLEVISQLDEWINNGSGMEAVYNAGLLSPRVGVINPRVFHFEDNLAHQLIKTGKLGLEPLLLDAKVIPNKERDEKIRQWLKYRGEVFSDPERIKTEGLAVLGSIETIVENFNNTLHFKFATRTPWRIWGEVKRHRTMEQESESIYDAIDRATEYIRIAEERQINESSELIKHYAGIFSIPRKVAEREDNTRDWISTSVHSIKTYNTLVEMGVLKSDAVSLIPRGIMLSVIKTYDFYNATLGYGSLRSCQGVEPEMRLITNAERKIMINSGLLNPEIIALLEPKCESTGYCPEKDSCNHVHLVAPNNNEQSNQEIHRYRVNQAMSRTRKD